MMDTLETPRLLLRPLAIFDAEDAQTFFPHWEIVQYLANKVPWPYPANGAFMYFRDVAIPAMERGQAWHWSIRLKQFPERLIGCINLINGEESNRGFWLGIPWHGQGFMIEACDEATEYWFNVLKFPVLRAAKAVANESSRKISQKQGMRVAAQVERDYVCGRLPSEIWEITADEWNSRSTEREERIARLKAHSRISS